MTCKDIMTRDPKCCLATDPIFRAAEIMRDEDVGPVPVVSDHNTKRIVGVVTDRDIAVKAVAAGRDPQVTPVSSVMSSNVITCRTDDDYSAALDCMSTHQIRRVPVVYSDGSLAGIISQADVARLDRDEQVGEVVEDISQPAGSIENRYRNGHHASTLLMSAAFITAGAGLMFLFDPSGGRGRRSRLRDTGKRIYDSSAALAGKIRRTQHEPTHLG